MDDYAPFDCIDSANDRNIAPDRSSCGRAVGCSIGNVLGELEQFTSVTEVFESLAKIGNVRSAGSVAA